MSDTDMDTAEVERLRQKIRRARLSEK
jgi:hypothetical protein